MKVSVSLPEEDLLALDDYVRAAGLRSRSAAMRHAIRLLASRELERDYAEAWEDWESSGQRAEWEQTLGDGLPDAAR